MHETIESKSETVTLLRDAVADFLEHEHSRERLRDIDERRDALSRDFWRQLAQQGWLALRWPESLDGAGLDVRTISVVAEQWGRRVVPEPLVQCAVMPAVLAEHLADGTAKAAWAALAQACISGETLVAPAWQDTLQTLDAHTTARAEAAPGGWRLSARKYGVVGASIADALLVTAQLEGAPALWLVPRDAKGLALHTNVGSDGGTVSALHLDGVQLSAQALLAHGKAVSQALEHAIDEALLLLSAQLIGVASAALDQTLDYMRLREQFGHRIGSFQAMQHAAVDARLQVTLARASLRSALQRHAGTPGDDATRAAIAAAKARASDTALLCGRFAVQAHGAIGFAAESGVGQYLKSAIRLAACLGNAGAQRERHGRLTYLYEPVP